MNKMVLFLISFLTFIFFLILVFQNVGASATAADVNFLVGVMSWTPGSTMIAGFIFGFLVSIPLHIFFLGGGNIKISSATEKSSEGNVEWD